ncbi:MAG: ATP-binding cassette domain-containing protein [Rhizobiaceae bacterium]|nr:ATP-binding cassette domain-containing protein [Rhizobiaceae bacterium]
MALLEVEDLEVSLKSGRDLLKVVDGISFTIEQGETLGIVGESGCGKSLTALATMGLLGGTPIRVTGGRILFEGQDLSLLTPNQRRMIMGNQMAMIFQEPMTSLNPVYRVGDQIIEALQQHETLSQKQARDRAIELLALVRIPDPKNRINSFPHQLSGGMRQRVMIAMALACDPKLLIADEPTTALDVTVQSQILDLIVDLQKQTGMAVILISHDLGVIAETCNKVAVMYRGKVIEAADADDLFAHLRHPYTRGLLDSIPVADKEVEHLNAIKGRVPTLEEAIEGCTFNPRCPNVQQKCLSSYPSVAAFERGHEVRCHFPLEGNE